MPFVLDVSHQKRAIEMNRAQWKTLPLFEETGADELNIERFDVPARREKLKAVAAVWIAGRGITD